jgi:hypothetical protein
MTKQQVLAFLETPAVKELAQAWRQSNDPDVLRVIQDVCYSQGVDPEPVLKRLMLSGPDFKRRYEFFKKHGYGKADGAFKLAEAEIEAHARDWTWEWSWDELGDLGDHEFWCPEVARAAHEGRRPRCEHEILYVVLKDGDLVLESLSNIIDPDPNYRRIVEAELALEALDSLER